MEKIITYFGQHARVACDEKCNKAWGVNSRPQINFDENDPDDFAYLSDEETGEAPIDPGTYEGGHAKPVNKIGIPNKWCVRECERCSMSRPGESHLPARIKDFSERVYNQPQKHQKV